MKSLALFVAGVVFGATIAGGTIYAQFAPNQNPGVINQLQRDAILLQLQRQLRQQQQEQYQQQEDPC